ncbi:MAG: sigma-70 family RNA polymerase sigma factor [Bacteroidia bacterium]|nr:sigma-70 family RNA polymerase sigma factor [Bacteroidia bacterium]NNJ55201.1 sigma-70 family RNA polymerase sigma factor [Bacteroidia bacterium]
MQSFDKKTDYELVDLTIEGDEFAFAEIIRRYKGSVATTAMNMLGDVEDAKEVGHQVFIRFFNTLKKYRKEASLNTYLTRMTINLCLNFLKRRKNFQNRSYELKNAMSVSTENGISDFESKDVVNSALQKLDNKHRTVIVLRMIKGYSTLETADLLQLPKGTVLSRLKRGMAKLKTILETEYNYEYT